MAYEKMSAKVVRTDNYSQFRLLGTNREIRSTQVKKILASIRNVGYIYNPIIVNEKMEIIDGQGRFAALKELGLPVDYIVVPGLGIEECRAMNINQSNWTTADYIHSYAEDGNMSYKWLEILMKKYKSISPASIYSAISLVGETKPSAIKNGEFFCTEKEYMAADKRLDYLNRFVDVAREIEGRRNYFFSALAFAFDHREIDNDRLEVMVKKGFRKMPPITNMSDALNGLSDIYNYRNTKQPRVYLENDYKRMQEANNIRNRKDPYRSGGERDHRGKVWDPLAEE